CTVQDRTARNLPNPSFASTASELPPARVWLTRWLKFSIVVHSAIVLAYCSWLAWTAVTAGLVRSRDFALFLMIRALLIGAAWVGGKIILAASMSCRLPGKLDCPVRVAAALVLCADLIAGAVAVFLWTNPADLPVAAAGYGVLATLALFIARHGQMRGY